MPRGTLPVAGAGILLHLALVALLVVAAGLPVSVHWARIAAARGFTAQEPAVLDAVATARDALDPLLGAPIGRIDTIVCAERRDGQICRLVADVVYNLEDADPSAVIESLQGRPAGDGRWVVSDTGSMTEIGPMIAGIEGGELRGTLTLQGSTVEAPLVDDVIQCMTPTSVSRVEIDPGQLSESSLRVTVRITAVLSETPMLPDLLPGPCLLGRDAAVAPEVAGFS